MSFNSARLIILFAITATITFSCSSESKKKESKGHDHDQMTEVMDHKDRSPEETGAIANNYLKIKDALVASDPVASKEAAEQLRSALENEELYNEAEIASAIVNEESIEAQRKTFETLSIRMYELASEQKFEFNSLYKQYCPMAFDNKGAFWLSSSKEIRNPYFGDKMLKCGRVEETLAKK